MSRELWRPRSLHTLCSMHDHAHITWMACVAAVKCYLCTSNSCNTCHPRRTQVTYDCSMTGMTVPRPAWLCYGQHDCSMTGITVPWLVRAHQHWVSFEQIRRQHRCVLLLKLLHGFFQGNTLTLISILELQHWMVWIWNAWDRPSIVLCVCSNCTLAPNACGVWVGSHIPCISIKFMENQRPIVLGRPRHDVSNVSCKVAPTFVCYVHKAKTYCDVRAYRADTMTIQVSMPQVAILLF